MAILTGTSDTTTREGPCKVKSVLVTADAVGPASVSLFRYSDTGGRAILIVAAPTGSSMQAVFDGVEFPDGLAVDPGANVASYVVEYA